MYTLELIKALSYKGIVNATRENPFVTVEDSATADKAVATGYFRLVPDSVKPENQEDPKDQEDPDGLEDMITSEPDYEALAKLTKKELTEYANKHEVDISGCKTNADILQAISIANGGSPTMIDLQKE